MNWKVRAAVAWGIPGGVPQSIGKGKCEFEIAIWSSHSRSRKCENFVWSEAFTVTIEFSGSVSHSA